MYQAGELPKTLRLSKIHYEPPKTVGKTPFASICPPSMENGDGTRYTVVQERVATENVAENSVPTDLVDLALLKVTLWMRGWPYPAVILQQLSVKRNHYSYRLCRVSIMKIIDFR